MNWQPIETAPKDGTRVLLYRAEYAESMAIGYYDSEWACWNAIGGFEFSASHWMPLPEPPQ